MELTLYRYFLSGATWGKTFDKLERDSVIKEMMKLPFQGEESEKMYGFARCGYFKENIYGLFIQKHPQVLTDYDPKTKKETRKELVDSGEYLFIIYPQIRQLLFQHRRSSVLPPSDEIQKKFVGILKLAFNKTKYMFDSLSEVEEKTDRTKVVNIFYKEADEVLEMEFAHFDDKLIDLEKANRGGKRQTYFNPKEEYQEGMEEAAISLAKNTERASIKAKQGGNLKKDPITRAMLEGSRSPTKIVYKKDSIEYTDSAVTRKKEVLTIEGPDMIAQIESLITRLSLGDNRSPGKKDSGEQTLFNE